MKRILFIFCIAALTVAARADYFVEVTRGNNKIYFAAEENGDTDFQGRQQFTAYCVQLQVNDVVKCFDSENQVSWAIPVLDPYGAHQKFSCTASGLTCNTAGKFDFYIKLKYEDDMWYVGDSENASCTPAQPVDPSRGGGGGGTGDFTTAAPAQCPDVMLQGFYWNSNQTQSATSSIFGRTKWVDYKNNGQAAEIGKWFDLIWLPPMTKSSGGLGYHPTQYSSLDSDLGTRKNLVAIIDTFHTNGCRVVADIVVNHCDGTSWCTFNKLDFGTYGQFQPTAAWICQTDEMNSSECPSECRGKATGGYDDGYDGEANYAASRDWDHGNAQVRSMIKAYLQWLRNEIGVDGFRYDYCKGFHMSHVDDYNKAAKPYFSVLEYWDGNPSTLQARLGDAAWNTLTFDFATYYTALKGGIAVGDYGKCRGAGLPGQGKSRYACTFVDSHDTFQRYPTTDVCDKGDGSSVNTNPQQILACNAYILSMPGVPCVFYPHWVTFKSDIKKMINARYKTGVHSESAVSDEVGNGFYKATITGTNGQIRLLLGPNSGYNTTPAGFTLAVKGTNWAVYYKENSSRGDKDKNRHPILPPATDIEEVAAPVAPAVVGTKVIENGRLYIVVDGVRFDMMGQRVD